MSLPTYLQNALEEIDAVLFSGDIFNNQENFDEFRSYVEKWHRNLDSHQEFIKVIKDETS